MMSGRACEQRPSCGLFLFVGPEVPETTPEVLRRASPILAAKSTTIIIRDGFSRTAETTKPIHQHHTFIAVI